jgi:hypothetical protein
VLPAHRQSNLTTPLKEERSLPIVPFFNSVSCFITAHKVVFSFLTTFENNEIFQFLLSFNIAFGLR